MRIDMRDTYEQIGNLFYAIATDQQVRPLQAAELKFLISINWMPRTSESYESLISEAGHWILLTIDTLENSKVSSTQAFNSFSQFFENHQELFTSTIKETILRTVKDISTVFPGVECHEHIEELKRLFERVQLEY
jgi:hypothetical protein